MSDPSFGPPVALTGWGRTAPSRARTAAAPASDEQLAELVASAAPGGVLARGLGRSYGDAAQNGGGAVVSMAGRDRVLELTDPGHGPPVLRVEAGASLDALLRQLVPRGLFLPVSPGTRWVTVGGAAASDVHGKNHAGAGTLSRHVRSLDLLTADGGVRAVGPDRDPELFWATAGGLGLTGVVLRAEVELTRIETDRVVSRTERAADLDAVLHLLADPPEGWPYSVAWIDCLSRGARAGRGVVTHSRHAVPDDLPPRQRSRPLGFTPRSLPSVPSWTPGGLLNRATAAAFNEAYYRRAPASPATGSEPLEGCFYPLDAVRDWNRAYGPRGFVQYQVVVPAGREDALREVVDRLAAAGQPSFLVVLKRLGAQGAGHLSFPRPGWTLALDLPAGGRRLPGLLALLDGLDEVVAAAGGRVYLTKDARLRPDAVAAMYPRLPQWRAVRDRVDPERRFDSDLARRLRL